MRDLAEVLQELEQSDPAEPLRLGLREDLVEWLHLELARRLAPPPAPPRPPVTPPSPAWRPRQPW